MFKAAESRINTEGLPLVGGDESYGREISEKDELFAPRNVDFPIVFLHIFFPFFYPL